MAVDAGSSQVRPFALLLLKSRTAAKQSAAKNPTAVTGHLRAGLQQNKVRLKTLQQLLST